MAALPCLAVGRSPSLTALPSIPSEGDLYRQATGTADATEWEEADFTKQSALRCSDLRAERQVVCGLRQQAVQCKNQREAELQARLSDAEAQLAQMRVRLAELEGRPLKEEVDSSGTTIRYVPVFMPHRCSNCSHECTGLPSV